MKLFSIDGKFTHFMNMLADVFVLNLCLLIGCIPVVTAGTSVIAAFSVGLKLYESRDNHVFLQFWRAYRDNLMHGILLTVIFFAIAYGCYLDFQLLEAVEGNPVYFLIIGIVVIFVTVIHGIYIFPLEARFENNLFVAIRNAGRIGVRFFPKTLLIIILLALEIFLFYGVNDVLFVIGCLIGPMTIIMTVSGIVLPIFEELLREAGEV